MASHTSRRSNAGSSDWVEIPLNNIVGWLLMEVARGSRYARLLCEAHIAYITTAYLHANYGRNQNSRELIDPKNPNLKVKDGVEGDLAMLREPLLPGCAFMDDIWVTA